MSIFLEKEMATHSSILAWRIPGQWSLAGKKKKKKIDVYFQKNCDS